MTVTIREAGPNDRAAWQTLWAGYLDFYESTLPSAHTNRLWERIHDNDDPIECRLAEAGDLVVGLVHFFPHPDTWRDRPACYLQDLYVDAGARGRGIGEELIISVRDVASERGWSNVYWLTAEDNEVARGLYDKVTGGANGFVVYEIESASNNATSRS